ncbi:MAG: hypothetical protein GWP91_10855 [Rhodobacterales bacterium]|nr:hypothetical protein [Rhodobacterales bacterium]
MRFGKRERGSDADVTRQAMAPGAAHLMDHVLPNVTVRQWSIQIGGIERPVAKAVAADERSALSKLTASSGRERGARLRDVQEPGRRLVCALNPLRRASGDSDQADRMAPRALSVEANTPAPILGPTGLADSVIANGVLWARPE